MKRSRSRGRSRKESQRKSERWPKTLPKDKLEGLRNQDITWRPKREQERRAGGMEHHGQSRPRGYEPTATTGPPKHQTEGGRGRNVVPGGESVPDQGTDWDLARLYREEVHNKCNSTCQEWGINYDRVKQYLHHSPPYTGFWVPPAPQSGPQRGPSEERTKPLTKTGAGNPGMRPGGPRKKAGDRGPQLGRRLADPPGRTLRLFRGVSR